VDALDVQPEVIVDPENIIDSKVRTVENLLKSTPYPNSQDTCYEYMQRSVRKPFFEAGVAGASEVGTENSMKALIRSWVSSIPDVRWNENMGSDVFEICQSLTAHISTVVRELRQVNGLPILATSSLPRR
jgi:hypothetical protein